MHCVRGSKKHRNITNIHATYLKNRCTSRIWWRNKLFKYTPHFPRCSFTLVSLIVANLFIQTVHSHQMLITHWKKSKRQTQILKTHSSKTILTEMIIRFHCFKIFADLELSSSKSIKYFYNAFFLWTYPCGVNHIDMTSPASIV